MNGYQKLEQPQLVELEGEIGFVIVTEIDISETKNGMIFMRGESYNYEDGTLEKQRTKEIQYSTTEESYFDTNEYGKILD
ncbi:hypothetical protein [Virgibacillus sp. CBA3643]|uniref:hypothetical protein n=1 Tax=Virgibacillus sp. CBA3643 TaxID=2942278 RepID=UPI0035A2679B